VLGLDHTDKTSFESVFEFVRETGLYEVQITIMTPFPGTPLYERLKRDKRLLQEGAWELCTLFDVNYLPEKMSVTELETGFRELGHRIYDDAFIDERRRAFFKRQSELRQERSVG
jgi:radical SAM superfamily enzyme YgiQ (UPF0313 family)